MTAIFFSVKVFQKYSMVFFDVLDFIDIFMRKFVIFVFVFQKKNVLKFGLPFQFAHSYKKSVWEASCLVIYNR